MRRASAIRHQIAFGLAIDLLLGCSNLRLVAQVNASEKPELDDVHFHLTNYIQRGTDIHDFLKIMGTKVGRVALFGIPLQQQRSYQNSGNFAPTYRSLTKEEQARFDPMITGFSQHSLVVVLERPTCCN